MQSFNGALEKPSDNNYTNDELKELTAVGKTVRSCSYIGAASAMGKCWREGHVQYVN